MTIYEQALERYKSGNMDVETTELLNKIRSILKDKDLITQFFVIEVLHQNIKEQLER